MLVSANAQNLAGHWEGSLQLPSRTYNLVLDFDCPDGKTWVGSVIIPGLGIKGEPLDHFTMQGARGSFALMQSLSSPKVASPKFEMLLGSNGDLKGTFLQAGNSAPFVLRKTGPPQVELPKKSTPLRKVWAGEWTGDYEMNGYPRHVTLTLVDHETRPATAQLVVIGKRTTQAPVDLITEEENFLTVQSREIGITYEGRLNEKGNEIRGTWTLGPFELPLVLRRNAKTE